MGVENSEELERRVIETFRKHLKANGMRPVDLTEDNNPNSTLKSTKVFKLFSPTPHRLAFADFIQISQLLNTSPTEILNSIIPDPDLYKISDEDVQLLEDALEYARRLQANMSKEN